MLTGLFANQGLALFGQICFIAPQNVWSITVIVRTFLRYSDMSDIFGLAYLVGQIED